MNGLRDCINRLKTANFKLTPQRIAIFDALAKTRKHPNIENICGQLKKQFPTLSIATVYNTLKSFEKMGLAQEIGTIDDAKHFDGIVSPHPHLICISCKKIEDLEKINGEYIKNLMSVSAKRSGYKLLKFSLNFYGYCGKCKKREIHYGGRTHHKKM